MEGTIDTNQDNTAKLVRASVGPVQGGTFSSTWSEEEGKIAVSKRNRA